MRNKTVTALLAFFLGVFGGHRFYLGQLGLGLVYLFTFGIFGIGSLIDFIVFLTMSEDNFNRKYNPEYFEEPPIIVQKKAHKVADEIAKLHELKEKGAITEAEFEAQKSKLLA